MRMAHRVRGPQSLAELFCTPDERYAQTLGERRKRDFFVALQEIGLVVSSGYSGTGGFECAVAGILKAWAKVLGLPPPRCLYYSATEICPKGRAALQTHTSPTKPLHIFGDLLDRLPKEALAVIKGIEAEYLGLWEHSKAEHKLSRDPETNPRSSNDLWGEQFVKAVLDVLKTVEFKDTAWCYVHERECPITPRSQPEAQVILLAGLS